MVAGPNCRFRPSFVGKLRNRPRKLTALDMARAPQLAARRGPDAGPKQRGRISGY